VASELTDFSIMELAWKAFGGSAILLSSLLSCHRRRRRASIANSKSTSSGQLKKSYPYPYVDVLVNNLLKNLILRTFILCFLYSKMF
jgi:hypothetical protein